MEAAGYKGEKLVYLAPTDLPSLNAISEVAADMFRKIGMNLDYVATDWGTVAQRFASHEPPEKGGWSMYPNYVYSVSMISPAANNYIRGSGPKAMFGWPDCAAARGTALAVAGQSGRRRAAAHLPRYADAGIPGRAVLSARRVLSGDRVSQQPDRRAGWLLAVLQCEARLTCGSIC